ncbi:MAG: RHS repeat-associated core domain-containing protein, partial [Desulfobacteraceae bacterium]
DKYPNDAITAYGYDSHGNLATITDAEDHITWYTYDDMGRMVMSKSADTSTILYAYDEAGNLIQKTDANNTTTRYVYDALNRLTHIHFADASQDIEYSYDEGANGIGRRTGMADPSGNTSFGYDARGRLVEKKSTISGYEYVLGRKYSPGRRLRTITYPSGHVVDFTSRHADTQKIKDITLSFSYYSLKLMSNLGYNPFSGAKEMDTGFGARIYNEQSECACLKRSNPGASMEQTYTYDNNRNLTAIRGTHVSWYNQDFGYDNLGRLQQAFGNYGRAGYEYDRVGNRLTRKIDDRIETYAYYPGTNRLELVSESESVGYSYDQNGNPTIIGNRTYEYDHNNRLVRVKEGGNTIAEYTYNGLGQRVVKKAGDKQTVFLYDFDGQIIAEGKPDGTYTAEYIYMGNTRLAKVDFIPNDTRVYYYANNYLGTPILMTDERGVVVWEAEYKPFGEAKLNPNSKVENNFRLPGQYFDNETGLHYNYHRYYDPKTGRYLTPDPIGLNGGINLFAYVSNNPINLIDPLGLAGFGFEAGGGIGIGGYEDSRSLSDTAASGIYIGAKPDGYAELGAYTYQQITKIGGGKFGLGITLVIYWEDAEKFFGGTTYTDTMTLGPFSQTWYYNECGEKIGRSFSLFGKGGGLSYEKGESEGLIFPLQ